LAKLQYHGRWQRQDTLRHYLHDAFSVYTDANMSAAARTQVAAVHRHIRKLARPPVLARGLLL
jgi:hypothetical protein